MDVSLVGDGPAAEAVKATCADTDATIRTCASDVAGDSALAVVVAPAGAEGNRRTDTAADRLITV